MSSAYPSPSLQQQTLLASPFIPERWKRKLLGECGYFQSGGLPSFGITEAKETEQMHGTLTSKRTIQQPSGR